MTGQTSQLINNLARVADAHLPPGVGQVLSLLLYFALPFIYAYLKTCYNIQTVGNMSEDEFEWLWTLGTSTGAPLHHVIKLLANWI